MQLVIGTSLINLTIVHNNDLVRLVDILYCVSNKYHSSLLKRILNYIFVDLFGYIGI